MEDNNREDSSRQERIRSAITAGERALDTAERAVENLKYAKQHGDIDVLSLFQLCDYFLTPWIAQGFVKEAELYLNRLRRELTEFDSGLVGMEITADIQCRVQGFDRYAGYIFGALGYATAKEQAEQALAETAVVRDQIHEALTRLRAMAEEAA